MNRRTKLQIVALGLTATMLGYATAPAFADDPLPSWNDGPSKKAIIEFVTRVTTKDSKSFVSPAERIAVFDNDGTLWSEQPMYFQFAFAIDRAKKMAEQRPE